MRIVPVSPVPMSPVPVGIVSISLQSSSILLKFPLEDSFVCFNCFICKCHGIPIHSDRPLSLHCFNKIKHNLTSLIAHVLEVMLFVVIVKLRSMSHHFQCIPSKSKFSNTKSHVCRKFNNSFFHEGNRLVHGFIFSFAYYL